MSNRFKVAEVTENGTVVLVQEKSNKVAIVTSNGHYFLINTTQDVVTVNNFTHAKWAEVDETTISYNTYDSPEG